MSKQYIMAIDLGTSALKTIIYDTHLKSVVKSSVETRTIHPRPTWAEQNQNQWWRGVVTTIHQAIAEAGINLEDVRGIGTCGQMHGLNLVDDDCIALHNCLVWPDLRAIRQSKTLNSHGLSLVNNTYSFAPYYTAAKLLWMKENHPSIIEEAYKILLPKDFIRARLTDTFFTDMGDAGGTQMYDHNTGGWNYKIADFIGIPHHKLPNICSSEKVVGSVTNRAAKETGLAPETPVITGVADARIDPIRRAMAELIPEGCILIYIGTAPSISAYTAEGKLIRGSFLGPGGGASKKWFKEQFGFVETKISELVQINSFELLDKEAEQVEPGSGGLLFLPHMMGERSPMAGNTELPNPYARGVLFGLCLGHKRQHIIRAIMEGVAYQLRIGWDSIKERNPGLELKSAMIYGGGAKSQLWRWIIANVFGFPVHLVSEEEVSALMCACSVAIGLGMYSDISEAVQNLSLTLIDVIKPHTSYMKKYTKLYELYRGVQNNLTESFNDTSFIEEYG